MRRLFTLFLLLACLPILSQAKPIKNLTDTQYIRVHAASFAEIRKIAGTGVIIDRLRSDQGWLSCYGSDEHLRQLTRLGFDWEPIATQAERYLEPEYRSARDTYHTYAQMETELQQAVTAHPNLCSLFSIGQSIQGRELYFLKISDNVDLEEDEPEFHYISTMHGNEPLGTEMCMYLIHYLLDNYGTDAYVTELVDELQIYIMPIMNPDGHNVRTRGNANGVDINRDFPDFIDDPHNTPDGRAPETAAMMSFLDGAHGVLSANFHTGELVVNYPWDSTYDLHPENDMIFDLSLNRYAVFNPPMYNNNSGGFYHGTTNGAQWYIVHGGMQDYTFYWHNDMQVTIELSTNFEPPASQLPAYWDDNRESMLYYMGGCRRGVQGHVRDAVSHVPVYAVLTFDDLDWEFDTKPGTGFFHKMLLDGTHSMTIQAFGYEDKTINNIVVVDDYDNWTDMGYIDMQPVANAGTISGYVIDGETGTAIEGAVLTLEDTPVAQQTTGANGRYSFSNIPYGSYSVRCIKDGYMPQTQTVNLNGANANLPFLLVQPVISDGFESGSSQWLFTGDWCLTDRDAYAGDYALSDNATGAYQNNMDSYAEYAQAIDVRGVEQMKVSFYAAYMLEAGYDYVYLEGSTNHSNWTEIADFNGTLSAWTFHEYDLTSLAAGHDELYLRFRFESDGSETRSGILIDNFNLFMVKDGQTSDRLPVHRFFNTVRGGHLYTTSQVEVDYILQNLPHYTYEGIKFYVYGQHFSGTMPVYRFLNTRTGIHLYTISYVEYDNIRNNLPHYNYEGVKFHVYKDSNSYNTPMHRFFHTIHGGHLYTISQVEVDYILNNLPNYNYEGIKFYVMRNPQ